MVHLSGYGGVSFLESNGLTFLALLMQRMQRSFFLSYRSSKCIFFVTVILQDRLLADVLTRSLVEVRKH